MNTVQTAATDEQTKRTRLALAVALRVARENHRSAAKRLREAQMLSESMSAVVDAPRKELRQTMEQLTSSATLHSTTDPETIVDKVNTLLDAIASGEIRVQRVKSELGTATAMHETTEKELQSALAKLLKTLPEIEADPHDDIPF